LRVALLAATLAMTGLAGRADSAPDYAALARVSGTPEIPGLKMVWLAPWGDPAKANPWRNIIAHQTEGPAGSARGGAQEQAKNPTRRGVTVWVETDGTVYWAVREDLIYHQVVRTNSIGVEFAGNFPNVAAPATPAQLAAWDILVRVLQARYNISSERIYAHNWIDFKDARYCEGCELAARARALNFKPELLR
jgi:hypothetical protein